MTPLQFIAVMTARALRADAKSLDTQIPKSQRDFHAGRREVYLQSIALWAGCEVKDIRTDILGRVNVVPIKRRSTDPLSFFVSNYGDGA